MLLKGIRDITVFVLTLLLLVGISKTMAPKSVATDAIMMEVVRHTNYTGLANTSTIASMQRIQSVSRGTSTNPVLTTTTTDDITTTTTDDITTTTTDDITNTTTDDIITKTETDKILGQVLTQCNTYGYATATLVHSIINQESDYRTKVVSVVGAKGIMQLMPDTFQYYADMYPDIFKKKDIFDVFENMCAGVMYLNDCYKAWESTASTLEDLSMLALASYNVGVTGLKTQYGINDANELKKSKAFPNKYAKQVLERIKQHK